MLFFSYAGFCPVALSMAPVVAGRLPSCLQRQENKRMRIGVVREHHA